MHNIPTMKGGSSLILVVEDVDAFRLGFIYSENANITGLDWNIFVGKVKGDMIRV